jgi:FkbM family methyltransferase
MKCAIIIPIGPKQDVTFDVCCDSVERAFEHGKGPFDGIEIIPIWDTSGAMSEAERWNVGIDIAKSRDCEWLFFLNVSDLMNLGAFASFGAFMGDLDAVWGTICDSVPGRDEIVLRENQILEATTIDEILVAPANQSLQMGHFARCVSAASVRFDTEMETGADFKFFTEMWSRFRCAKVSTIFSIQRAGERHAPVATQSVLQDAAVAEATVLEPSEESGTEESETYVSVNLHGKEARFAINNPLDLIQRHHLAGLFFEVQELRTLTRVVGTGRNIVEVGANIGNHLVFYAQHMHAKKIFPFEPNPDAVALLSRNIKANKLESVVDDRGVGIGLGAEYGKFSVVLPGENNLGAAQLAPGSGELEVFPLDEKLGDEKVDFMKIDVEGMEFEVLAGAVNTIRRNRPILMIEVFRPKIDKFEEWCKANDYRVIKRFDCINAVNFLARAA